MFLVAYIRLVGEAARVRRIETVAVDAHTHDEARSHLHAHFGKGFARIISCEYVNENTLPEDSGGC